MCIHITYIHTTVLLYDDKRSSGPCPTGPTEFCNMHVRLLLYTYIYIYMYTCL